MRKRKNDIMFNQWFRDESYIRETIGFQDLHLFQITEITVNSIGYNQSSTNLKVSPFDPDINSISKMIIGVLHLDAEKFDNSANQLDDLFGATILCLVNIDDTMEVDTSKAPGEKFYKKANVLRPKLMPELDLTKYVWLVGDLKYPFVN